MNKHKVYKLKETIKDSGYVFSFGKHKGEPLSMVVEADLKYVAWLVLHKKHYDTYKTFDWVVADNLYNALEELIIKHSPYRLADNGVVYDYDDYCARNSLDILENELMEECFCVGYWG